MKKISLAIVVGLIVATFAVISCGKSNGHSPGSAVIHGSNG